MKYVNSIQGVIGLLVLTSVSTGISGCDQTQDIRNWVDNTDRLRAKALEQAETVPYRKEQHQALKVYFSEIGQMALSLKNDAKFRGRFNEATAQANIGQMCQKTFIPKAEWERIVARCRKNRFFLCAEEVRAGRDMVLAIRSQLRPDLQARFDQAATCRDTL